MDINNLKDNERELMTKIIINDLFFITFDVAVKLNDLLLHYLNEGKITTIDFTAVMNKSKHYFFKTQPFVVISKKFDQNTENTEVVAIWKIDEVITILDKYFNVRVLPTLKICGDYGVEIYKSIYDGNETKDVKIGVIPYKRTEGLFTKHYDTFFESLNYGFDVYLSSELIAREGRDSTLQ